MNWALASMMSVLGAADTAAGSAEVAAAAGEPPIVYPLQLVVELGVLTLVLGMVLCLYRILRGPHLADRVLAADGLSLHVVGLVILLAIRMRTSVFFDVALVVAIIGFTSTLAFAQYIGARGGQKAEAP